jgi:hypothetical protein
LLFAVGVTLVAGARAEAAQGNLVIRFLPVTAEPVVSGIEIQ